MVFVGSDSTEYSTVFGKMLEIYFSLVVNADLFRP